jgi:hypothetical protein
MTAQLDPDSEQAALVRAIADAFAEVEYPGDVHLIENPRHPEYEELTEFFRGTTWRSHSAAKLRWHSRALSLFTPAAWHYFLPAFVIADLEDPLATDVLGGTVRTQFAPTSRQHDFRFASPRMSRLTAEQRKALAGYFRYCLRHCDFPGTRAEFLTAIYELEQAIKDERSR